MKKILCCIIMSLLLLTGCQSEPEYYVVSFDIGDATLVSGELNQRIMEGESAVAPVVTNGRMTLSWSGSYFNVDEDTVVTAVWTSTEMSSVDIAAYVQERTVTVNVTTITGGTSTGTGFFIDSEGTLVTNYHVIDMAESITVTAQDGGTYEVKTVVDFSPVYDIAVLKLSISETPYLTFSTDGVKAGEQVYAVGSALGILDGTFTAGTVSSVSRTVGKIECIQTDAAISNGNSGGPLVNVYAEVVGINSFGLSGGENLNLAIIPETLDNLAMDKNYSVNDFREWYILESSRSYSPWDSNGYYYYSLVNTYQTVTGSACKYSVSYTTGEFKEGFYDMYDAYAYEYKVSEFDEYTAYLKANGFDFLNTESFDGGVSYYYYNYKDTTLIDLYLLNDNSWIYVIPTLE